MHTHIFYFLLFLSSNYNLLFHFNFPQIIIVICYVWLDQLEAKLWCCYRLLGDTVGLRLTLLMCFFSILFDNLQKPRAKIEDAGSWHNGDWEWNFAFNYQMLLGKSLTICSIFCAVSHSIRIHSISSCGGAMLLVILAFVQLSYLLSNGYRPDIQSKLALNCIWKLNVISNIQVFVWRLLLKRLKTIDKLAKQGDFPSVHRLVCLLCFGQEKNHCH